jgi:hypothetical protein
MSKNPNPTTTLAQAMGMASALAGSLNSISQRLASLEAHLCSCAFKVHVFASDDQTEFQHPDFSGLSFARVGDRWGLIFSFRNEQGELREEPLVRLTAEQKARACVHAPSLVRKFIEEVENHVQLAANAVRALKEVDELLAGKEGH